MLEARIVSARGSLYFASRETQDDLESLRAHVRDLALGARRVRVYVCAGDAEWTRFVAAGWLDQLARAGASVHHCTDDECAPPRRSRAAGG